MNPVHKFPPYFSKINSKITLHLGLGLPSGLFFQVFPTKILYAFFIFPCLLHAPSISCSLISSWHLVISPNYEAPHEIFSSLPPLPPPYIQIFSSAPCSQIPSIYVPPLMWQAWFWFHTHTKQQNNPNLMSIFRCLSSRPCVTFSNKLVFIQWGVKPPAQPPS
jgi:hypothetical protein